MNEAIQPLLNLALTVALISAVAYTLHKCRRIHLKLFEAEQRADERSQNLFAQVEALLALNKDLDLHAALPATRGWAGSPDFLRHVQRAAMRLKPESIVECSSGVSTIVLARAAQLNSRGHVFSLEHDPVYAQKTRDELARQGLQAHATVLDAPLRPHALKCGEWKWYETAGLPATIDLLVIDGPPWNTQPLARYPAVAVLDTRLSEGGRVILDDANRPDEQEAVRRWGSEFGFVPEESLHAEKGIVLLRRRT